MRVRILAIYSIVLTGWLVVSSARQGGTGNEGPSIGSASVSAAHAAGRDGATVFDARGRAEPAECRCGSAGSAPANRVVAPSSLADEQSDGAQYESMMAEELHRSARSQVDEVKRHIALSPELEKRLYDYYRGVEEISRSQTLSPEEAERRQAAHGTEEMVLGAELSSLLATRRREESERYQRAFNEKEIVYLIHSLHLTPEQESALRATYDDPERYNDVNAVNLAHAVQLRDSQALEVRKLLSRDFVSEAATYVAQTGEAQIPLEDKIDDGTGGMVVDYLKLAKSIRRKEIRQLLSDEQFNRFLEYEANNEDF